MSSRVFLFIAFIICAASLFVWMRGQPGEAVANEPPSNVEFSSDVEEAVTRTREPNSEKETIETQASRIEPEAPSVGADLDEPPEIENEYEARLTLDKSLEIAFSTNAVFAEIHRELTDGIDAEFPMLEGTYEDLGVNEQGFHQIYYVSLNGEEVNQWYDESGNLVAEEVLFPDTEGTLTRWYKPGSQSIERIRISEGNRQGMIEFDSTARPSSIGFWDGPVTMSFKIEE